MEREKMSLRSVGGAGDGVQIVLVGSRPSNEDGNER